MIGAGVYLYIVCVYVVDDPQKVEWHFSGQLSFSNTRGRLLVEFID